MPEDQVATYLADVRERHALITGTESGNFGRLGQLHNASVQLSHVDAGRLLAACDAALVHHQSRPMRENETLSFLVYAAKPLIVCGSCRDDAGHVIQAPCPEVRDITAALLGEAPDHA